MDPVFSRSLWAEDQTQGLLAVKGNTNLGVSERRRRRRRRWRQIGRHQFSRSGPIRNAERLCAPPWNAFPGLGLAVVFRLTIAAPAGRGRGLVRQSAHDQPPHRGAGLHQYRHRMFSVTDRRLWPVEGAAVSGGGRALASGAR
ncbi:hypothetical protein AOLI_G00189400 [Acnodon oligacanthus]